MINTKNFILPACLIIFMACQDNPTENKQVLSAASFFPEDKAKVLVVGSFHFDYPGLDAHQIEEDNKVDVLKEPKKSELTALVEHIKKFRPTKIAVEALPDWNATEKLRNYKKGKYRDERDERYQIAMRIAEEEGLDTLYAIDSGTMAEDIMYLDTAYSEELWKDFDFKSDDPYDAYATEWLKAADSKAKQMTLLDYFKMINSRTWHQHNYGLYLIGDFKLDNERGADILSYWWYNRNVRIFRKLQTITENKNDRVLVVFGNGHAAVLRQLIECSPEYEFVELSEL